MILAQFSAARALVDRSLTVPRNASSRGYP